MKIYAKKISPEEAVNKALDRIGSGAKISKVVCIRDGIAYSITVSVAGNESDFVEVKDK